MGGCNGPVLLGMPQKKTAVGPTCDQRPQPKSFPVKDLLRRFPEKTP